MADLTLLATLKHKLIEEEDFAEVSRYFFDHFGDDPTFLDLGEPTRHPFLEQVVAQVAAQVFGPQALAAGQEALLASLMLTRLPEQHFVHGGLTIANQVGNLIYFEDEGVGLLTIVM